eukprot:c34887_g1_i1.p1 GENE.c34887_g1_i1~~c34887_g1_i1.p1  ORF type:complete len:246 (+),score=22.20 c34887_g1_i1:85-822(+)
MTHHCLMIFDKTLSKIREQKPPTKPGFARVICPNVPGPSWRAQLSPYCSMRSTSHRLFFGGRFCHATQSTHGDCVLRCGDAPFITVHSNNTLGNGELFISELHSNKCNSTSDAASGELTISESFKYLSNNRSYSVKPLKSRVERSPRTILTFAEMPKPHRFPCSLQSCRTTVTIQTEPCPCACLRSEGSLETVWTVAVLHSPEQPKSQISCRGGCQMLRADRHTATPGTLSRLLGHSKPRTGVDI